MSVMDVLTCLYYALDTPVQRHEYDTLPTLNTMQRVNTAYFARCGQILDPKSRNEEAMNGVKRIDFLMGRNHFSGLTGTSRHSNVWELSVTSLVD